MVNDEKNTKDKREEMQSRANKIIKTIGPLFSLSFFPITFAIPVTLVFSTTAILITTTNIGPDGPQGNTGLMGDQGPIGFQGIAGLQGGIGPLGPDGATGVQGETGQAGTRGATGPRGEVGPAGSQSEAGPQGELGPAGLQGDQGIQGIKADQGVQGVQGVQGNKGDPGVSKYEVVSNSVSWSRGGDQDLTVGCPEGKRVLGGGHAVVGGSILDIASYPTLAGNAWIVSVTTPRVINGGSGDTLFVYAICAAVEE